jgi:hypothetical protein
MRDDNDAIMHKNGNIRELKSVRYLQENIINRQRDLSNTKYGAIITKENINLTN